MQAKKQLLRPKHIPQRTCIACRRTRAKRELVRIVRTRAGTVEVDPTGKEAGRGAYLCRVKNCWEIGLKGNRMGYTLKTKIASENRAELLEYGKALFEIDEDSREER